MAFYFLNVKVNFNLRHDPFNTNMAGRFINIERVSLLTLTFF